MGGASVLTVDICNEAPMKINEWLLIPRKTHVSNNPFAFLSVSTAR